MATKLGGKKELEQYLLGICKELCEFATNEVYEAINFFLSQYYREWKPSEYSRTEEFLRSAFKTEVKKSGNGYRAVVGIDYESLDNYNDATGFEVVSWANEKGIHGGLDVSNQGADTAVFDDAIDSTINSGQLLKDCIEYLRSKGFTIIT